MGRSTAILGRTRGRVYQHRVRLDFVAHCNFFSDLGSPLGESFTVPSGHCGDLNLPSITCHILFFLSIYWALYRAFFCLPTMSPISDASAGTTGAVQPPTAPSGPPQRQSCDRCHKQKLRCIRNKNTNSGVCDRCLSKRAQCVYSLSLPKGRPSLHRPLNDETNTGNHVKSGDKEGTSESIRSGPKSRPLSAASKPTQPIATCKLTLTQPDIIV